MKPLQFVAVFCPSTLAVFVHICSIRVAQGLCCQTPPPPASATSQVGPGPVPACRGAPKQKCGWGHAIPGEPGVARFNSGSTQACMGCVVLPPDTRGAPNPRDVGAPPCRPRPHTQLSVSVCLAQLSSCPESQLHPNLLRGQLLSPKGQARPGGLEPSAAVAADPQEAVKPPLGPAAQGQPPVLRTPRLPSPPGPQSLGSGREKAGFLGICPTLGPPAAVSPLRGSASGADEGGVLGSARRTEAGPPQ